MNDITFVDIFHNGIGTEYANCQLCVHCADGSQFNFIATPHNRGFDGKPSIGIWYRLPSGDSYEMRTAGTALEKY